MIGSAKTDILSALTAIAQKKPAEAAKTAVAPGNSKLQIDPKVLQERDSANSLIKQLESSRSETEAERKEQARQKLERLKAQMMALRMMATGDPKAAAKQAARVARELAQAAREYAGAGGSGASGVIAAPAATGASASATDGATAAQGTAEAGIAQADGAEVGAVPVAAEAEAVPGEAGEQKGLQLTSRPGVSVNDDDRLFASEARMIANELKRILKRAEDKDGQDQDAVRGGNAVADAEKSISAIESGAISFSSVTVSVPTGVNVTA